MSNVAISDLPVATVINATDIIPFVQPASAGTTKTITKTLLFTSPTMVTPVLGTPASGTLTNTTGLPLTTGVTGTLPVANGGTGVTTSTGTTNVVLSNSPTLVTPALGAATGTSLTLTGLASVGTTLGVTGNTSLATTPVLYSGNGSVSSGRLIGRYSYETATPGGAYFFDYNNTSTISIADATIAALLATSIDTTITNANALTAFGTSYGAKNAGLSFVSGTQSDILRVAISLAPLLDADINAVVVGYTAVGPRILIQNYALNDDTANAISYVGDEHRFYYAGSVVAKISSIGLGIAGSLTVSKLTGSPVAATTIASAATIAPIRSITFISGTAAVETITAIAPFTTGGGTITLIPTGVFTWTTAGNIALAGTAVVSRALTMTYDSTTTKWYPSYV